VAVISLEASVRTEEIAKLTGSQLGRLRDGDSNQDVCTKLSDWVKSDLCKSVVSISLCNGDYAAILFLVSNKYILKHYQLSDSSCNLL